MKYNILDFLKDNSAKLTDSINEVLNSDKLTVQEKIETLVKSKNHVVTRLFESYNNKFNPNGLGVKEAIEKFKAIELYEGNIDFSYQVDDFEEKLKTYPEYLILENCIALFKPYLFDKNVAGEMEFLKSVLYRFKSHILVTNAINDLKEQDEELNKDLIYKLEKSYHFPADHVKALIHADFHRLAYRHPIIQDLMDKLQLINPNTQANFSGYGNQNGRIKISKPVIPYFRDNDSNTYIMLRNNLYNVNKQVKKVNESMIPKQVLQNAKILSKSTFFENQIITPKETITVNKDFSLSKSINEGVEFVPIEEIVAMDNIGIIDQIIEVRIPGFGCLTIAIADDSSATAIEEIFDKEIEQGEISTNLRKVSSGYLNAISKLAGVNLTESLTNYLPQPLLEDDSEENTDDATDDQINLDGFSLDDDSKKDDGKDDDSEDKKDDSKEQTLSPEDEAHLASLMAKLEKVQEELTTLENLDSSYQSEQEIKDLYLKLNGKKALLQTEIDKYKAKSKDTSNIKDIILNEQIKMENPKAIIKEEVKNILVNFLNDRVLQIVRGENDDSLLKQSLVALINSDFSDEEKQSISLDLQMFYNNPKDEALFNKIASNFEEKVNEDVILDDNGKVIDAKTSYSTETDLTSEDWFTMVEVINTNPEFSIEEINNDIISILKNSVEVAQFSRMNNILYSNTNNITSIFESVGDTFILESNEDKVCKDCYDNDVEFKKGDKIELLEATGDFIMISKNGEKFKMPLAINFKEFCKEVKKEVSTEKVDNELLDNQMYILEKDFNLSENRKLNRGTLAVYSKFYEHFETENGYLIDESAKPSVKAYKPFDTNSLNAESIYKFLDVNENLRYATKIRNVDLSESFVFHNSAIEEVILSEEEVKRGLSIVKQ